MTRKLTASILCLSLLPSILIAANSGQAIKVSGTQQEETAFERIFWNKTPVSISLRTGKERLIHFPDMVRVKPPQELTSEDLKVSGVDNVVYLKALKDFPVGRMKVQTFNHNSGSFEGGKFYLIDLSAKKNGGIEPVKLIDKLHSVSGTQSAQAESVSNGNNITSTTQAQAPLPSLDMVELVRFASHQLYGPERLMESHPAIYRSPLQVKTLKSLYRGGGLKYTPLASWKGGGMYVTAIKLQNNTQFTIHLDPRLFRGQWRSRTLQHASLSRYKNESDTTTVYLLSDRPFHESLWF